MKKIPVEVSVGLIFCVVGVFFVILGILLGYIDNQKMENWIETNGTIVDIQYNRGNVDRVIVEYEYEGRTREGVLDQYDSSMYEGKAIVVLINPENLANLSTPSSVSPLFIFIAIALIAIIVGVLCINGVLKKKRKNKWLLKNGICIPANVQGIGLNYHYASNGQHPYVINCFWKDDKTGIEYRFQSENLWFNPASILAEKQMTTLPVFLDPQNYQTYYVGLDEIITKN